MASLAVDQTVRQHLILDGDTARKELGDRYGYAEFLFYFPQP
jgi:adenylylsulfate kinase-like enzyme